MRRPRTMLRAWLRARLWGWSRSLALATAALIAAASLAACGTDEPDSAPSETASTATSASPSSSAAATPSAEETTPQAAERVFTTWARPSLSYDQWWAALRPMLSTGGQEDFANTDPAQIPALDVSGAPAPVKGRLPGGLVDEGTALVKIPTTVGTFGVFLTRTSDAAPWRMLRLDFPEGIY